MYKIFLVSVIASVVFFSGYMTAQVEQFSTPAFYKFFNYKIQPSSKPTPGLNSKEIVDATYYNQERIAYMKVELSRSHREIQELRREMKELQDAFTRFKNYYFRQI